MILQMNFPLFDRMYADTENMTTKEIDPVQFCETVKTLDEEGTELLYALMKCYAIQCERDYNVPPFHGKKLKAGYRFDVSAIPLRLLVLLNYFLQKHNSRRHDETRTTPTP
jgi:hypothetical protein